MLTFGTEFINQPVTVIVFTLPYISQLYAIQRGSLSVVYKVIHWIINNVSAHNPYLYNIFLVV